MGEDDRVIGVVGHPLDESVRPNGHPIDLFPVRHVVVPLRPAGPFGGDLFVGTTFDFAVVPFHQVVIELDVVAGEPGRVARPPKGARVGRGKGPPFESDTDLSRLLLSRRRQRQVRPSCVATGARPLGLSMPDQNQSCSHANAYA